MTRARFEMKIRRGFLTNILVLDGRPIFRTTIKIVREFSRDCRKCTAVSGYLYTTAIMRISELRTSVTKRCSDSDRRLKRNDFRIVSFGRSRLKLRLETNPARIVVGTARDYEPSRGR